MACRNGTPHERGIHRLSLAGHQRHRMGVQDEHGRQPRGQAHDRFGDGRKAIALHETVPSAPTGAYFRLELSTPPAAP